MSQLQILNESTVLPEQIDSLGHMNVRYYIERADDANRDLLAAQGISPADGQVLRRVDTFTRFHREQFEGATLQTLGGLLASEDVPGIGGVRAYFEIRHVEKNEVAATFVVTSDLVNRGSQAAAGVSLAVDSQRTFVEVPDYGRPRSLTLTAPASVSLAQLEALVPDEPSPGMMSGRRERSVHPDDCDDLGRLREDIDLMFVLHRPEPGEDLSEMGPPLLRDELGRRYSWAMMEIRSVVWHRPKAGERVVSIGADLATGDKWRHSRRWMFEQASGTLLGVSDSVGICIDLDARKAMSIPREIRGIIENNCLPQLI